MSECLEIYLFYCCYRSILYAYVYVCVFALVPFLGISSLFFLSKENDSIDHHHHHYRHSSEAKWIMMVMMMMLLLLLLLRLLDMQIKMIHFDILLIISSKLNQIQFFFDHHLRANFVSVESSSLILL